MVETTDTAFRYVTYANRKEAANGAKAAGKRVTHPFWALVSGVLCLGLAGYWAMQEDGYFATPIFFVLAAILNFWNFYKGRKQQG
jgi:hypothetical protein